MRQPKDKREMKRTNDFWCETCNQKEPMTPTAMKEHLKSVHGLDGKVTGRRELQCALDMEGGQYSNTFKWTLPGNVILTSVSAGSFT